MDIWGVSANAFPLRTSKTPKKSSQHRAKSAKKTPQMIKKRSFLAMFLAVFVDDFCPFFALFCCFFDSFWSQTKHFCGALWTRVYPICESLLGVPSYSFAAIVSCVLIFVRCFRSVFFAHFSLILLCFFDHFC